MDGWEGSFRDDGGKCTGFVSHHEEEWRLVGYRVRAVIVGKFSKGDVLSPRSGVRAAEDSKICLNLLIYSFGLSIRLRVIGSGEGEFVPEEFS